MYNHGYIRWFFCWIDVRVGVGWRTEQDLSNNYVIHPSMSRFIVIRALLERGRSAHYSAVCSVDPDMVIRILP